MDISNNQMSELNEIAVKKVRIDKIIREKWKLKIIKDAVRRTNLLCIHTYQFVRLWLLGMDEIPAITKDTFKMAFKALSETGGRGRKAEGKNGRLYKEFEKLYAYVY